MSLLYIRLPTITNQFSSENLLEKSFPSVFDETFDKIIVRIID